MKLSNLKANPKNPRLIKDDKFNKIVKSIKDFPEMLEKRPIIVVTDTDGKMYPLGGNMRLKALQQLKYKDIPDSWIMNADDWTIQQRNEFLIKDNVGYGEWDWDILTNEWDAEQLEDWGLDLDFNNEIQEKGKIVKENLEPYKKTHILISFSPEKMLEIQDYIQKITEIEGVEYEQSSN